MSENFTLGSGYIAAEVRSHPNAIYGTGRPELPVLVASFDFLFRGPQQPGRCYEFRELSCRVSPFEQTYIAHSLPTRLKVRVHSNQELPNQLIQFEIPLDRERMAVIDRLRRGGDVSLRLDMQLAIDELVEIPIPNQSTEITQVRGSVWKPGVWGIVDRNLIRSKITATIPRSDWVDQVLSGTGFSKTHLIELPAIPLEDGTEMKASFSALQHAVKLEKMGLFNEAVGQCRIALEPFFETTQVPDGAGGSKPRRTLNAAWQTRLGQRTYDWLNGSFLAVKQATNQPHHPSSSTFDQMEAQMLLMITTALISYAVKTQPATTPRDH